MTSDYSWDIDSALNTEHLTDDVLPARYALTAPQVVVNDGGEILLIDPHAVGTWNTWMFPYASLILTRSQVVEDSRETTIIDIAPGSTFGDLTKALVGLRRAYQHEYVAAVRDGVNNIIPNLRGTWQGTEFYTNYSLKFSHTSNVFTAYEFNYFLNRVTSLDLDIPHFWTSATALRDGLSESDMVRDRKISSNVVEALDQIDTNL